MNLGLTNRTKVLAGVVVLAGALAAAWFLYLEEWLAGPPPAPVAPSKPAATVAKAATPAPASKPAAPEAPKPAAVAETPKPVPVAAKPQPVQVSAPAAKPAPTPVAAPAVVVQEPAKPVARRPARPAAKGPAKPVAVAAADPEKPKPAPAPREAPAPVPAPVVVTPPTVAPPAPLTLRFNDLVTAVLYRDAGAVNDLLEFGKWPDKPDSRGTTPLALAVELGDAAIAEALLKAGADPDRAMNAAREGKNAALTALLGRYSRTTSQRP